MACGITRKNKKCRLKLRFSDGTVYIDNNFLRKYNDYILSEITDILNLHTVKVINLPSK